MTTRLKLSAAAACAALAFTALAPAKAEAAAAAYAVTSVNLRAGPGTSYPVVVGVPSRAALTVYGCNAGTSWCDVSWSGERGWISASYVQVTYHGSTTVISPAIAPAVGVAVVGFSYAYWNAHYVGRPWYGHWDRHHHHGGHHHPDRVKAAGGCVRATCGGVAVTPRRVAAGKCGPRGCSGTVIKRPHAGPRVGPAVRADRGVRTRHGAFARR